MDDYHINIFFSAENECYIADLPDFKHCSAFSDTPQVTLRELLIAKKAWMDSVLEAG